MSRPLVKICGVTRHSDAGLAAELGADLLGLNFYSASPRCVAPERAAELAAEARARAAASGRSIRIVGLFVNEAPATVLRIDREVRLDLLQFHGEETPADVAPFAERALVALRFAAPPTASELAAWGPVWGFLFEPRQAALYGGSGREWPYETVAEVIAGLAPGPATFVAGGVTPESAASALARSCAGGVDVCSGVESVPGRKDPDKLRRFMQAVRSRR